METAHAEVLSSTPPKDCPITVPQDPPFTPPAPYSPTSPFPDYFWYGDNSLWTLIPNSGIWAGLPHDGKGYGQKVFWWREGYSWTEEPQPEIIVTAERLDASVPRPMEPMPMPVTLALPCSQAWNSPPWAAGRLPESIKMQN